MVRFYLNDITSLDAAPIAQLKTLVPFGEDELLDGLAVDPLSRLFQLLVVEKVEATSCDVRGHSYEDNMAVVCGFSLAR